MAPNRLNKPDTEKSEQEVLNKSFDREYNVLVVHPLAYNRATNAMESIKTEGDVYSMKIDELADGTVYVGKALAGSATSSSVWQIKKISVSGTVTTIAWADGNQEFDNSWDNRALLSYS